MNSQDFKEKLEQLHDNPTLSWVSSGYDTWDRLSGGLVRGGLTVIGGRPAMGKTSLCFNIASRLAQKKTGTILIFSTGMPEENMAVRLMQIGMDMEMCKLLDGSIPAEAGAKRFGDWLGAQKGKIKIQTQTYLSLQNIWDGCDRIPDLSLVIVDDPEHIYEPYQNYDVNAILKPPRVPIEKVMKTLNLIAEQFHVPVISTVTMPRSLENRKDKRPLLSDLEAVGVPEELPDQVVFLYRHAYYHFNSHDDAECIIAKTRYGKTGTVWMTWKWAIGRLNEISL